MNTVYVVTVNSWNGEYDSVSVVKVFENEDSAKAFVDAMNAKRTSSYSTSYEYEEMGVE